MTIGTHSTTSAATGGSRAICASSQRITPKRPSHAKMRVVVVHSHSSNRNSSAPTNSSAVRNAFRGCAPDERGEIGFIGVAGVG